MSLWGRKHEPGSMIGDDNDRSEDFRFPGIPGNDLSEDTEAGDAAVHRKTVCHI